jgi:PAS domain S-box-containing protein
MTDPEAARFMRALADHLPAMITYWGSDLKCRFANANHGGWFGRSAHEMIGVSIMDYMGESLFLKNQAFIRGVLSGKKQVFERKVRKPSGDEHHVRAQYIPDVDPERGVVGFYAFVTDVSPHKEIEERLTDANVLLQEAHAAAEAAARTKSAFLSNMSHELRNPLTSIIGFAELLAKRNSLSGTERRYLDCIQQASEVLLATVNDILDFSKLEAGQVEIERRPVDPAAIGLSALQMFEPDMQRKGLTHRFEAVDLPAHVSADDSRIRQILTNMIGNAVKFTATGSVTLHAAYDLSRRVLRFEVIDTGRGIPVERQLRLFQRFSQVDGSTSRASGGTGLGLAICKGLAEAMQGQVGASSAPGEGSCFWVEIPCDPIELETIPQRPAAEAVVDPDALRGLRLLIVDDDPKVRELIGLIAEPLGVLVTEARGGAEAVSAARSSLFDIILMDIRMPEIDGCAAAQIIRSERGRNTSTPIIAFTAEMIGEIPSVWTSLFDGLLAKPIVSAELIAMLADRGRPGGRGVVGGPR